MLFATFASMGISAATVPATLPSVAVSADAGLDAYLPAVPALFSGLLIGVLLSAAVARWISTRTLTAAGAALQSAGFVGLAMSLSAVGFIAASALVGVGFGLVEAGGSVLAREIAGRQTARLLSALTGSVAVAAAGMPLLIALTPLGVAPRAVYVAVAVLHGSIAGLWMLESRGARQREVIEPAAAQPGAGAPDSEHQYPRARVAVVLAPIAFALLLYVGVETVYAGWSAAIPAQALSITAEHAAIGTSVFWVLLAAGRYLATYLLGRGISSVAYLLVSTLTAALALAASSLTFTERPWLAIATLAVAVAALGPCYSIILGIGLARVPLVHARRVTGVLVACGALGGSLTPSALLLMSDEPTSATAVSITAALTIAVGGIVLVTSRATRRARGPA